MPRLSECEENQSRSVIRQTGTVGVWGLREEARKGWDHAVSNEVVYLSQSRPANLESSIEISEHYIHGDVWFEVHFTCPGGEQGDTHFNAILEINQIALPVRQREMDLKRTIAKRNNSVLVDVPKFIELPEGIILKSCPTQVRLKLVKYICHCGWKQTSAIVVRGVSVLGDKEADVPFLPRGEFFSGIKMGQPPRQQVERRAQIVDEVTQQDRNRCSDSRDLQAIDVESILEIGLLPDGIRFATKPNVQFPLKLVEVMTRPCGLHFYVDEALGSKHDGSRIGA